MISTQVAEGVDTAFALEKLIKRSHKSYRLDLKFPIIFGVAAVAEKCTNLEYLNVAGLHRVTDCVQIKSSTRLQCARIRMF